MRRLTALCALLFACSNSNAGGNAAAFAGDWAGNASLAVPGRGAQPRDATMRLRAMDRSALAISGLCSDGTEAQATALDSANLSIGAAKCAPAAIGACDSAELTVLNGAAVLDGDALYVTASGVVRGCGATDGVTIWFSGTQGGLHRVPQAAITAATSMNALTGVPISLTGSALSATADAVHYAWTLDRPAGSSASLSSATAPGVSFTPDVAGTYTPTLIVTQGVYTSAPAQVVFTAAGAPHLPLAVIAAQPGALTYLHAPVTLEGGAEAGVALTYAWSLKAPGGSTAALSSTTAQVTGFTPDVAGNYVVALVVTDGAVSSAPAQLTIVAVAPTPPPTAVITAPAGPAIVSHALTLSGAASNGAGALSYAWTLLVPQGSASVLDNASGVTPTFTPDTVGTYVVSLVVAGASGTSAPAVLSINVTPTPPPTATATCSPASATIGTQISCTGVATSPSAAAVAFGYAWSLAAPSGSATTLSGATTSVAKLTPDVAGTYTLTLIVSDGSLSSAPVSVAVTATLPPPPPVAVISGPATLNTNQRSQVSLDGSQSHGTAGVALTYAWSILVKPGSSTALLSRTNTSTTTFTPDVAGTYQVQLVVANGSVTSPAVTVTVIAAAVAPIAVAKVPTYAQLNTLVALDGTGSIGSPSISWLWALSTRPASSTATMQDERSATAHVTPDVIGAYTATLTVTDGSLSATTTVTFQAEPKVQTINFRPVASAYSRALDRLVSIAAQPDQLHIFDPVAQTDRTVTLPLTATCLSLSTDGLYAAVGYNAWVSYVDLTAGSILATWPISAQSGSVVLGDPITVSGRATRFAYVFPAQNQWVSMHDVDLGNGTETLTSAQIYAGMRAQLQPGTLHLFGVTTGLSPVQLYRFDLNATTGLAGGGIGSPYWGDYAMGGAIWISSDGAQIMTQAGTRFRTTDMTYAGALAVNNLVSADWSQAANRWLVQPGSASGDGAFWTYDAQYLGGAVQQAYPHYVNAAGTAYAVHGRAAFYDSTGAHQIAVVQIDSTASALQDFAVIVY